MPNTIYRGPANRAPRTISDKTVAAALLPGTAVFVGTTLTQAASASGGRLALLSNRDFYDQSVTTAYATGDTGVAYRLDPEMEVLWAMAAGTYTTGQELTVAASGRLAAAVAGNIVVAHYDQAGATLPAGALADVVTANRYTKA